MKNDQLMMGARLVVRIALWGNRLVLAAIGLGLIGSLVLVPAFADLATRWFPGQDVAAAMAGMRWLMLLGFGMAIATDRLLVTLAAIIASAAAGDPFIADNATRLRAIGGWLLALQLAEIPGFAIQRGFPALGAAGPDGDIAIGGWIAVLMVFVLARVFAVGAAMRDELAATV